MLCFRNKALIRKWNFRTLISRVPQIILLGSSVGPGRGLNNQLQRQWAFINTHTSVLSLVCYTECNWVFSPQAVTDYWLPPLACRVHIGGSDRGLTPIPRPVLKGSLSLCVTTVHVWQTWPTFLPFFLTRACHCFKKLFSRIHKRNGF